MDAAISDHNEQRLSTHTFILTETIQHHVPCAREIDKIIASLTLLIDISSEDLPQ